MRRFTGTSSIRQLLERYKNSLRAPQGTVVRAVAEAFQESGVPCVPSDFSYSVATKTISLRVTGPRKTEMLLRKGVILNSLKRTLARSDIPHDIV